MKFSNLTFVAIFCCLVVTLIQADYVKKETQPPKYPPKPKKKCVAFYEECDLHNGIYCTIGSKCIGYSKSYSQCIPDAATTAYGINCLYHRCPIGWSCTNKSGNSKYWAGCQPNKTLKCKKPHY